MPAPAAAGLERLRSPLQIAAVVAAAAASLATSPVEFPRCVFGSAPFDGQTNVPVDGPFVLVGRDLSDALPALGGTAFRLERIDDDGAAVKVTVSKSGRQTVDGLEVVTWTVAPAAPLAPDSTYRLVGIDLYAVESAHHVVDADGLYADFEWPAVERTFYTGSAPRLLAAVAEPPDDPSTVRIRLLFSEPMDLDSLAERVTVRDLGDVTFAVVEGPTASEDRPHEVTLRVGPAAPDDEPPWAGTNLPTLAVEVSGEARGRSGVQLYGAGPLGEGLIAPGITGRTTATWDRSTAERTGATGVLYGGLREGVTADVWFDALFDARPVCDEEAE